MKGLLKSVLFCVFVANAFLCFAPDRGVKYSEEWVNTHFYSMTQDEKIAQLFMIEVRPTLGQAHLNQVRSTLKKHRVGGVIFFKGDPLQQAKLTNAYQEMSKVPLMVAIDGEWGLAMRLSNTTSFPYQMGLGGIKDNKLIYEMGREIGRQCKIMGIHVNFAPVIDVNNNPKNPVINYRSFGEDRNNVAMKGWAYAKGLQDENVMACAKHFPGHGDTDVDSHKDLPVIKHSRQRLDSVEFYPFVQLIDSGVKSVMTAHLYIPAIDKRKNVAISISDKAINGILRKEMGFKGLAFTDALNMQGVAKFHEPGELELKAFMAGNDILLSPGNIPKATQLIKAAIEKGDITQDYLDQKVRKILTHKFWAGLGDYTPVIEEELLARLNSPKATKLLYKLIESQIAIVKDELNVLPLRPLDTSRIAIVSLGTKRTTYFQKSIAKFKEADFYNVISATSAAEFAKINKKLKQYDLVILGLHKTSKYPTKNYRVTATMSSYVAQIHKAHKAVFVDFGNAYNLRQFKGLKTVVMAYQDDEINHLKAAQVLFGANGANAHLPVTVNSNFKVGSGKYSSAFGIMSYAFPEEVGVSRNQLRKIDSLAKYAVRIKATPGCQVLVARKGKIIFEKSYGYHTYASKRKVKDDDLYDLASLTKVAATTLAVMKLTEDSTIRLDDKLSTYLKDLDTTNKKNITIRQVLTHTAGLKSWIPFYKNTLENDSVYASLFSDKKDEQHTVSVGKQLYMNGDYQKEIFNDIYTSEMKVAGKYKYSDLGMILMRLLIEKVTKMPFERYMDSTFYKPMGLTTLSFLPLNKFKMDRLVPTEVNADYRKGLIKGYVHDPAAGMLGGVSGHAGLFGTSSDLAAVLQMLLNGGTYNGHRFLKESTIKSFTAYQIKGIRRGMGFDKPEPDKRKISPCSEQATSKSFGHSGFTGTYMWADPEYDIVYIFLSNRVHPTADNKLLIRKSIRTDIMDQIYESIIYE
jgi:beta-N-acetylhexosaminidase